MAWFGAILCIGFLWFFAFEHSQRFPRSQRRRFRRWFIGWAVKGVGIPAAVWLFFNLGLFDKLPPLFPEVEDAAAGVPRALAMLDALAVGLFVAGSYWAALTSGWLLYALYRESDMQREFRIVGACWSFVLGPVALMIWGAWGWMYAGLGVAIWFMPLLQIIETLAPEPDAKPNYTRAVARMHFDRYEDAESAVLEELEKSEDDFDGWMLLAQLYAEHFHDLPEAERTIRETCAQASTNDSQRSIALHKLADWQLQLASDPVGARRALGEICQTSGNAHLAHMARLRMEQLPETREEWIERRNGKRYRLPALRNDLDSAADTGPGLTRDQAAHQARLLVEKLQKDPNHPRHREELARLLAEKLDKVDAGLDQLALLLTLPDQPDEKTAEWLSLMAAWQLQFKRDEPAARAILERLIHQAPNSAAAFAAQRRLSLMDIETRMRAHRSAAAQPPNISVA